MLLAAAIALWPGAAGAFGATISPTTTDDELADNSVCSLREAVRITQSESPGIEDACAPVGPLGADTIQLAAGTYTLDIAGGNEHDSLTGDLDFLDVDGTALQGAGVGATSIVADPLLGDRLLNAFNGTLEVDDLTLSGGAAATGGNVSVEIAGNLELRDSAVDSGTASADGGGIAVGGSNVGPAVIERSLIQGNTAPTGVGGGIYASSSQDLHVQVTDSSLVGNHALQGGGMALFEDATVLRTRVHANVAEELTDGAPSGGGIRVGSSMLTVSVIDSVVTDNEAISTDPASNGAQTAGGGIYFAGSAGQSSHLVVRNTSVAGNELQNLGATPSQQQFGAGVMVVNGDTAALVNSTISGNTAALGSGGLGGGLYTAIDTSLISSTIAANQAAVGDGLAKAGANDFVARGSILSGPAPGSVCSLEGSLTSQGYNVALGGSCNSGLNGPGDASGTDPMLGPLASNSAPAVGSQGQAGAGETHALAAGGPAVDRVPPGACGDQLAVPLGTDQRGFPRPSPSAGNCDSGAFELSQAEPPPPDPPLVLGTPPSNAFSFGKLKRNKKKGIAFLIVNVPGPGEVGIWGPGIRNLGLGAAARRSIPVSGGRVKVPVKPGKKGKKARKLRKRLKRKGKAKVKARVAYLPTGGTANTKVRKLKLVRK